MTALDVLSVFRPESPETAAIAHLFLVVLWVCAVVLAVVVFMVVFGLSRFRGKPGQPEPKPTYGNRKLETVWTAVPLLVVLWLLVLTGRGMRKSDPPLDQKPDLLVITHQWWWEVRYPKTGVVTANEIHIPVGPRWLVDLESADVIHDFWVPRLARKMDAVPGHPNRLWLEADKPGSYLGTCAEYCGAQHGQMHFLVIAQSAADYEAWQKDETRPAVRPLGGAARAGSLIFQQMTCVNCHAVGGTAAQGQTAPDLTHFGSRQTFGAVLLPNTPQNLARWLKNPQSIKPEALMPDLKLKDSQVKSLVVYLESLR